MRSELPSALQPPKQTIGQSGMEFQPLNNRLHMESCGWALIVKRPQIRQIYVNDYV